MLITASRIHDGHGWLPEASAISLSDDGTVLEVLPRTDDAVFYEGVLCPGFVNAHCHLELSHMKGLIPEQTGLIPFLQQVMKTRGGFTPEQLQSARHEAYTTMLENGIVAVGDIANTTDTLDLRALGQLHVRTFVESIGFSATPQKQFTYAQQVHDAFAAQQGANSRLGQSIVPHAPYSVSDVLFRLIDKHQPDSIISIHNQESPAEDEYYLLKLGGVQTLLHSLGINDDFFLPSGKSSLQTYLQWLSAEHGFIFVHNTYTKPADIEAVQTLLPEAYWCFCPNANLYIEGRLPNIPMFLQHGVKACVGTDSLASNHQLDILAELVTINKSYPAIGWEALLQWASYNGACALRMQDIVGSIAQGLKPGILQLTDIEGAKPAVKRVA